MAAKKKARKKASAKKSQTRRAPAKKSAKKSLTKSPKKSSRTQPSRTKASANPTTQRVAKGSKAKKRVAPKQPRLRPDYSEPRKVNTSSADPDSQGLSEVESADSESVGELLDEGNTFEAGVVKGVEEADDSDGKEVRTREFPEDDVPEEYIDQD